MPTRRTVEYREIACSILSISALLGCTRHTPPPPISSGATPPPPFTQSAFQQFSKQDPCNLLEAKQVEEVLGAPLAVPPFRSSNGAVDPMPTGESCAYVTASFRSIILEVTYEGGATIYSMVGSVKNLIKSRGNAEIENNVKQHFKLDEGTEMTGEWDEASLTPFNCCIFNALRGDQLITINFTASYATLRQAGALIDAAYKRMEHPLKYDGAAAVGAARAFNHTRPQPVDVCSILTRAQVEAIIGPLHTDPVSHGTDGCTYELPPQQEVPQQYEVVVDWRGGYAAWRSDQYVAGIGGAALAQMAEDQVGHPLPQTLKNAVAAPYESASSTTAAPGADPAGAVTNTGLHLAAVRRDVQVSVASRFVDGDKAKALVAAVLQKI